MPLRHTMLALTVVVIWGVNFVVIHFGLQSVPPILFAALRFVVVLPAVLLVPRPAVSWSALAAVGLLTSAGQFGLLYTAMAIGMPAGLASLVLQAQVLFTVLIAVVALGEHPSRRQLLGVVIGAAGLVVVAIGRQASTPLLAVLFSVAAAVCWASGNIVTRAMISRSQVPVSGLAVTVWGAIFVPVPLLALSLFIEGPVRVGDALTHLSLVAIVSTLYTAVFSTLFGYGVWNSLLGRHPAAAVAPFTLLVPVVGMIAARVVLGEIPNAWEGAGGGLLFVGVAVAVLKSRRNRPAPSVRSETAGSAG